MQTQKNALVTGATGFIGSHLVDRLINENMNITVLVRAKSNLRWIKSKDVQLIYGDLSSIAEHSSVIAKQDYIFHCAGLVRAKREGDFFKINTNATLKLIDLIRTHNKILKKFIFLSSLEAGGPSHHDQIRCEKTPDNPVTAYGKSKLEAEKKIHKHAHSIPSVIIRPPLVYGPRDIGLLEFAKLTQKGISISIGNKDQYVSAVYIDDLIDAMIKCAITPLPSGITFYINDQESPHSWKSLQNTLKTLLNINTTKHINLPKWLFWIICQVGHLIQLTCNVRLWINKTRFITLIQENWSCSARKIQHYLNLHPSTPISKGLNKTISWYKKQQWLAP